MLQGLRTVIYHVNDLAAATAFYTNVVGAPPYFNEPFYVGFKVGGYELGLLPGELVLPPIGEQATLLPSIRACWQPARAPMMRSRMSAKASRPQQSSTRLAMSSALSKIRIFEGQYGLIMWSAVMVKKLNFNINVLLQGICRQGVRSQWSFAFCSAYIFNTSLPKFSPLKSFISDSGKVSIPSTTCSFETIFFAASQPPISIAASLYLGA